MKGLALATVGLWVILQTTFGPLATKLGLLTGGSSSSSSSTPSTPRAPSANPTSPGSTSPPSGSAPTHTPTGISG